MIYDLKNILIHNDDKAEEDITKVINDIIELILNSDQINEIIALLLGGGFGRGEGSVILKGDKYITSNDYDIFAICKDDVDVLKIKNLEKSVESSLGLSFFGIDIIKESAVNEILASDCLSQSYFDFLYGTKILWLSEDLGKRSIIEKINSCKHNNVKDIKVDSAFDVLKTRMWCVVALDDYKAENIYDSSYVKNPQFFYFQQVKVATAIIDAVLIAEQEYKTPCFVKKISAFSGSNFSKLYDTKLVVKLVDNKIKNTNNYNMTINEKKELHSLYVNCVDYLKRIQLVKWISYAFKEKIKYYYKTYIKHEKQSFWKLNSYKNIKKYDAKQLIKLQERMRGIYK